MPFTVQIDPIRRRCTIRYEGRVTAADFESARAEILAHPDFDPDFDELVDHSRSNGMAVPAEAVRELATKPPIYHPSSRRALVAPSAAGFGMGRMYELLREGKAGDIRVFREADEAMRWLEGIEIETG